MAVAVKNPPVAPISGPFDRMPVVSLVGAAYVLACLGIVFGVLPYVWQPATGLTGIGGMVLLGLVMIASAAALGYLGVRLIGPTQPAGARAGIAAGLVGFFLVLLLTRWASLWIEYWIYANHWLGDSPTTGLIITGMVGVGLLIGLGYLFFRPEADTWLVRAENQGWFSGSSYKGQQGQRVRRGTMLGILLIAGSGVYTMMNNGLLHRMSVDPHLTDGQGNLALHIPFTGVVPVVSQGDAGPLLKALPKPEKDQIQIQIVSRGASSFIEGQVVSQQKFRDALKAAIDAGREVKLGESKADALDQPTKDALKKDLDDKDITEILDIPGSSDGAVAALGPAVLFTSPPPGLPRGVLRVSQYTIRKVNDDLRAANVRVLSAGDSRVLKAGAVIPKAQFDEAAVKVSDQGTKPVAGPPFGAAGPIVYQPLSLLPAMQFTLPLLLIVAALWLAWRVVNYPPFADFLIATEAELNKVSWTTRPRLIQDTIVVLVTVILFAVFLASMDLIWKYTLSWKPIGVLQLNEDSSDKNKNAEQKPW